MRAPDVSWFVSKLRPVDDGRVRQLRAVALTIALAWCLMGLASARLGRWPVVGVQTAGVALALTVHWLAGRVRVAFEALVHAFILLALCAALAVNALRPPPFDFPLLAAMVAPPIAAYLLGVRAATAWTAISSAFALILSPLTHSGVVSQAAQMLPGEVNAAFLFIHCTVAMTAIAARRATDRRMGETAAAVDALRRQTVELEAAHARAIAASDAKSQFLATMSHELRTPLNGVLGMATLLAESPLDDRQRAMARTLLGSGEALLAILNDVLDSAKLEAGRIEVASAPYHLRTVLGQVADLFGPVAAARGLALTFEVDPGVPDALAGDEARLRQVLANLVGNALKFTDAGCVLLRATVVREDGTLRIEVIDTGIGIREDRLEAIFAPFTQADASTSRRYGGTGLGLTIARDLVRLMGGRLWASSRPGAGATFHIALPLRPASLSGLAPGATRTEPAVASERALDSARGLRVLVVDDQEVNLLVVRGMLEARGHEVELARSGVEALARVTRTLPEVVLTDVQMPDMDGIELNRRLREALSEAWRPYVVALSANAFPEHAAAYASAGMDFLPKPVRTSDLAEVLARAHRARLEVQPSAVAHLQRMRNADAAAHASMITAFVASVTTAVEAIGDAVAQGDLEAAGRAAHVVAGNCGALGALGLARAAAAVEFAARDGDVGRVRVCADGLVTLWRGARPGYEAALAPASGPLSGLRTGRGVSPAE